MKILYAGDSPVGGPANYLLGVLRHLGAKTTHVAPSQTLKPQSFEKKFDAAIFSDYSAKQCSSLVQRQLADANARGMGFMMIGGWGSFSGPFGNWKWTLIESILPVHCSAQDDRTNFPSGAAIHLKQKHGILGNFPNRDLPVLCGLNHVTLKENANVILTARRIQNKNGKLSLVAKEYPLLIVSKNSQGRVAVLTTDVAPHWCGGMVDWGKRYLKLPVTDRIQIEVGDRYVHFLSNILRWLTR